MGAWNPRGVNHPGCFYGGNHCWNGETQGKLEKQGQKLSKCTSILLQSIMLLFIESFSKIRS